MIIILILKTYIQEILNGSKIMHLDGNNIRDEGMIHLNNIISNSNENDFEISIKRNYITDNGINNFMVIIKMKKK